MKAKLIGLLFLLAIIVVSLSLFRTLDIDPIKREINSSSNFEIKRNVFENRLNSIIGEIEIVREDENKLGTYYVGLNGERLRPDYSISYLHQRPHLSPLLLSFGKQGIMVIAYYDNTDRLLCVMVEHLINAM